MNRLLPLPPSYRVSVSTRTGISQPVPFFIHHSQWATHLYSTYC